MFVVVLFHCLACFGFDSCLAPAARVVLLPAARPVAPVDVAYLCCDDAIFSPVDVQHDLCSLVDLPGPLGFCFWDSSGFPTGRF